MVVISDSTVIPSVTGDLPGSAKGIKSGTVAKRVQHDQKSKTVSVNGERAIRQGEALVKAAKAKKGSGGSKIKGKKKEPRKKKDKKDSCCPKDAGPGGKKKIIPYPVDLANGEELLDQFDFAIDGPLPVEWVRSYRSGSEHEGWGWLSARWATQYTTSLSITPQGMVYSAADGRAVRFPKLAVGEQFNSRAEGVIVQRDSERQFSLTWRDGSQDTLQRGVSGWLPHGWDGINITEEQQAPLACARCHLRRSQGADDQGFTVTRFERAAVGG